MRIKTIAAAAATLSLAAAAVPAAGAQAQVPPPPMPIVTDPCAPDYPCTPNPHYDPLWPKKLVTWAVGLVP
jgi:hypothetical protein